jgi:hypothetical protein
MVWAAGHLEIPGLSMKKGSILHGNISGPWRHHILADTMSTLKILKRI